MIIDPLSDHDYAYKTWSRDLKPKWDTITIICGRYQSNRKKNLIVVKRNQKSIAYIDFVTPENGVTLFCRVGLTPILHVNWKMFSISQSDISRIT